MKRIAVMNFLLISTLWCTDAPFNRGVNLTNWFQGSSAQQIQFTKFTRQDFINIKNLGCDVIRLPINLHYMTSGEPDYIIDTLLYFFLDKVINIAEELSIHLILDNHTFDPAVDTDPNIGSVLITVWTQVADRYKDRSNLLYYEILNEPHGISDADWNTIQQDVVTAIRTVDSNHTIIIGPSGWNSYNNLNNMPEYNDDKLLYTFHFYDPFLFTHQGASWTDPSMVALAGVPFPYDATRMPECPAELVGTWIQNNLNNYANDGSVAHVKELLDIALSFKTERNIPIFCGEFGVYIPNSNNEDRAYWYQVVREYLEKNGIAWTIWDYTGGFGLFEAGTNELFDYDLNIPVVEALGLTAPPQFEYVLRPDTIGFEFYSEYIGPNILESSWTANGIVNYYSNDNPFAGNFCIHWADVDQYEQIGFTFKPIKDLSGLVAQGYAIDFWIRGDTPETRFDIRFIDTKTTSPDDHPWRMRMTIDESLATWDDSWQHVQIPLSDFTEHGSWDNEWFNPQGDFDWSAIDQFQIVAEHESLAGVNFWFDNIRIIDPTAVSNIRGIKIARTFKLSQNYPNPFNSTTLIKYELNKRSDITIAIYDLQGSLVKTLVDDIKNPGVYSENWNASRYSSGVYFYRIDTPEFQQVRKMILLK